MPTNHLIEAAHTVQHAQVKLDAALATLASACFASSDLPDHVSTISHIFEATVLLQAILDQQ